MMKKRTIRVMLTAALLLLALAFTACADNGGSVTTPTPTTPAPTTPAPTTPAPTTPAPTTPTPTTPAPTTPPVTTVPPVAVKYTLTVINGKCSLPGGSYAEKTSFTATATPPTDARFICWTRRTSLAEGGEIVSTEATYRGSLTENTVLYGNYTSDPAAPVIYRLQGGSVAATGASFYLTSFLSEFHLCYNAVGDVGTFTRPGYALLEYNTKADGSGTAVNPGGKIPIPESGILELYAVWEKESDPSNFRYVSNDTGLTITAYIADESRVIIPSTIGGKPVTEIAQSAFSSRSFVTVYIPSTVDVVASGAFVNCKNFDELYLCDTIQYIYNDSFKDCGAFTRFRYNAAMAPVYAGGGEGNFSLKFELVMTEVGNSVVVVAGSSGLNGLDSPTLEQALGGRYQIINYGTNMGTNGALYMEAMSHFLEEGDIVVACPEYSDRMYGSLDIGWKVFRGNELCYNIFRYVDISHYTNLFGAITEINTTQKRLLASPKSYEDHGTSMNAYGDTTANTKHTNYKDNSVTTLKASMLSAKAQAGFNLVFGLLADSGVTVYMSFPPLCTSNLSASSDFAGYINALNTKLENCTVISDNPMEHTVPYELMYNSKYHPNREGAIRRTKILARDILAQLAKEGK